MSISNSKIKNIRKRFTKILERPYKKLLNYIRSLIHSAPYNYTIWVKKYDTLTPQDRINYKKNIQSIKYQPLISIIIPVYNTPEKYLRLTLDSALNQIYQNFEICIADDLSPNPAIRNVLEEYKKKDPRIKVIYRDKNGGISEASNSALELASGDYVAFLDHDDELAEAALYFIVATLNKNHDLNLIFTDQDQITKEGKRIHPFFKPGFNFDLLFSRNTINHLGVYKRSLLQEIGGLRKEYDGSQDYDLALRVVEKSNINQIYHIPKILYHWRTLETSVAHDPSNKEYAFNAAKRALEDYFKRTNQKVTVELTQKTGVYRVKYTLPESQPLVTILIPTRDQYEWTKRCVESILAKTTYRNYEIIIINNQSTCPKTLDFFKSIPSKGPVQVLDYNHPYNYSSINNFAVTHAKGEILCFLNNDTEVISPDWLEEMVSHALRPGVGIVGAKLYFLNGWIQHAGIVLGKGLSPRQIYSRYNPKKSIAELLCIQDYDAVTTACAVMKKSLFEAIGGYDEINFPSALTDVDLCLKLHQKGYRTVWTPFAELYHGESISRGDEKERNKAADKAIVEKWPSYFETYNYVNPNLTVGKNHIFQYACPPQVCKIELNKNL